MVVLSRRETQVLQGILDGKTLRAIGAHGRAEGRRSAVAVGLLARTPANETGTRDEDPRRDRALQSGTSHESGAAIAISVKTMELLLTGLRRYAKTSTTTELLRLVVEHCAGLI